VSAVDEQLQIVYVPVNELRPYKGNPRKVSEKGLQKLQRSVEEFGFVNPILVQRGTNMIIAGHQRLKAAQAAGLSEVPVVWLDMDDVTAKAYNIADNRLQDEAEWDFTPLADLLTELDTGAFDLTLTGFDTDELERMMNYTPVGEVQEDEAPEPPEEAVTKPGDIWQLGRHRVMCGDSANLADVERLMQGLKADMVFTDPPYNVASEGRNYAQDVGNMKRTYGGLAEAEWDKNFNIEPALDAMLHVMAGDCAAYVCTSQFLVQRIWDWAARWAKFSNYCVWCKPNPAPCLSKRHWTWATELMVYAVRGKHVCNFPQSGHALNWWEIVSPTHTTDHPTEKPVAIPTKAMEFSSAPGALVLDVFLGSGTTLIAAEQLGRTCYGMEIDPRYCDVTVKRWEQLTGKHAELVQNQ
jgi:DNA modification methylase